MAGSVDRAIAAVLLAVHAGLVLWAAGGLAEYLVAVPPWPRLANPLFTPVVQLLHWIAIAAGGMTFVAGFVMRWRWLPEAMIACYVLMAAVCAIETFGYLEHPSRFLDMALEYVTYSAIVVSL